MRQRLWIPTAIFFVGLGVLLNVNPDALGEDTLRLLVSGLSAAVICWGTCLFATNTTRFPWYMLAAAHAAFALGIVVNLISQSSASPDSADIFFLGMHPFLWTSLVLFTWDRDRTRDLLGSLDAFIIGMCIGTPTLAFAIEENLRTSDTVEQGLVYATYTLFFLVGLILLIRLLLTAGQWHWPYWMLISSYGTVVFAQVTVAYYGLGSWQSQVFYDIPYTLFFILPAVLAMHPSMSEVQTAGQPYQKWPTPIWRSNLLVGALLLPVITLSLVENHPVVNFFVIAVSVAMIVRMRLAKRAYSLLFDQLRVQNQERHDSKPRV